MTTTASLNVLLEKTSDWDKDERYMATNDLCTALSKDIKIDENMEQRICAAVLKQLDDQSNDVQSVAVKCLAIITKKVQQAQIGDVCKKLISLILEGKDALRDVYSIGLKTLIADVPDSMGALVSDRLTAKLLSGISRQDAEDIQRECLDNMADLLRRFGHLNASAHHEIMSAVVKQLQSDRAVIRKRAAHCLGALVVVSSDALLNSLVQILLEGIEASTSATSQSSRTLIQTIGTISRTVGYRLGRHLERIVPLFLRFCGDPEDENQQNDAANELRESCFPGLESFVLRCPKEVVPFLPDILQVAVGFMKYDPNYSYDSEEEGSDGDKMSVDNDDDNNNNDSDYEGSDYGDEDQGGGSDDDDASWKVRKAAVKVILAVVQARPDLLSDTWNACGLQLVRRFKEREENVRLDIMHCFESLIQASCSSGNGNVTAASAAAGAGKKAGAAPSSSSSSSFAVIGNKTGRTSLAALLECASNGNNNKVVQAVVKACCDHLAGTNTSAKTKSAVFALLRALVSALNGGLDRFLPKLMPLLEKCLADKNQALKLDALVFLRCLLEHHSPSALQPHLLKPLDAVVVIVQEDWYKVIAEALRVLTAMVPVLRPIDAQSGFFVDNFPAFKPCVQKLFKAVWPRLDALDIDQEIKEGAIIAMGELLSHAGDELSAHVPAVLAVYKKRLENETTRSSTLKAVATLARSSIQLDLSSFFTATASDLAMFLRQASRSLKQLTLQTLEAVVSASATQITTAEAEVILTEAAALISDMDLHLSHLSLQLANAMLTKAPAVAGPAVATHIYPKMLTLARSALMQGQAQLSLIRLFQSVVRANLPSLTYEHVFAQLYSTSSSSGAGAGAGLTKQGLSNLSKCVAGIASSSPTTINQSLQRFTADLNNTSADESQKQLALLCLGELGHQQDLSSIPNLQNILLQSFESPQEDTKLAAAYALGHIAVGNTAQFLPILLQSSASSKHQYLLLVSLKELVVAFAQQQLDFASHLSAVLPLLLQQCRSEEDSVRAMVAECLGVLTTMLPQQVLPVLLQLNADPADTLARRMIAHALRFSLSRSASSPAALVAITTEMHQFLPLLQDSDLDVKKAALLMVNTAVHHNPSTVEHHLGCAIIPALIVTLQTKEERIVDLGPFKHRVDDYLPLRKIALTCLETLLDESPEKLDLASLVQVIPLVLADKDELKTQAHQILCKLSAHSPTLVAGIVEQLIAPLTKTIGKKPAAKDPSAAAASGVSAPTGPEADRALDLVKSALRAVLAVNTIDDIANINRKWAEFADKVKKDEFTAEIVRALENEKAFEGNY